MSSHRVPSVLLAATLLVPGAARAVDGVTSLNASRIGDDLVIAWSAPAPPVDGYRVYKANDLACASLTLLYEGPATSFTVAGAFTDLTAGLYGVAAYQGADEGPRSAPVYKYPVTIAPATTPIGAGGRLVSLPHVIPWASDQELCTAINPDPRTATPLSRIVRSVPEYGVLRTKFCASPFRSFNFVPQEAYLLIGSTTATTMVWGIGDTELDYRLEYFYSAPPNPNDCEVGMHYVSLPYDHAYGDLAELAAEIPNAVRVAVFNPDLACPDVYATGLSRASSTDPWSGTNVSLEDRRGEGVVVAVEASTTWRPRRQCTTFGGPTPLPNQAPVADAGGPYNSALCNGGVIGIWLDGTASYDPDQTGALRYNWTSTCSGLIEDPTAAVTPAVFDCDVCNPLSCAVILAVTDAGNLVDIDTEVVSSRQRRICPPPPLRGDVVVTSGPGAGQP